MANVNLKYFTNPFFASVPKSHTQTGSISVKNTMSKFSCLGTFKQLEHLLKLETQFSFSEPVFIVRLENFSLAGTLSTCLKE
jgi:hypothetical protein